MTYEELPSELREQLEATRRAAVRYSSRADEPNDKVDDVILLAKDSPIDIDQLSGYHITKDVSVWYNFVTKPYQELPEKCVQIVRESLGV